jgi:hypothetical protein
MYRFLPFALALFFATSALAQTDAERAMVAEGWGRGVWQNVHTIFYDPEAGEWMNPPPGEFPWENWTVKVHSPFTLELSDAFGRVTYVELLEGTYRDIDGFDGDERVNQIDHEIREFEIYAADDWRLVYAYAGVEGQVAELRVLHDVFTWSNYRIEEDGERRQTMWSIHRLTDDGE